MIDNRVVILYRISNSKDSESTTSYNAFEIERNGDGGVTLEMVKRNCLALRQLSHAGPDGYHWRVRVDDHRGTSQASKSNKFSWWDVQDESARLPVKENATVSELERMFTSRSSSPSSVSSSARPVASAATSVVNRLGKAMKEVANTVDGVSGISDGDLSLPRVSVIAFKLLDLVKVHDDCEKKMGHATPVPPAAAKPPKRAAPRPVPVAQPPAAAPSVRATPTPAATAPARAPSPSQRPQQQPKPTPATAPRRAAPIRPPPTASAPPARTAPQQQQPPQRPKPKPQQTENLMDFGSSTPQQKQQAQHPRRVLRHAQSVPVTRSETRAERLKREYQKQAQQQNRVWDDVDQRWVAVECKVSATKGTTSAPPSSSTTSATNGSGSTTNGGKVKGISIDPSNAIGKSSNVQAAVRQRHTEMKSAQQKAISELKEREAAVKAAEEEEDQVRKKLEPKIKAWSEEHGKKKQLRALLSSLHVILWEGSGWKQVCLGDILDEKKARRCYLKATLKVHPDKTRDMDAEKRFIAKRVFDALSQAMKEFDNNCAAK